MNRQELNDELQAMIVNLPDIEAAAVFYFAAYLTSKIDGKGDPFQKLQSFNFLKDEDDITRPFFT